MSEEKRGTVLTCVQPTGQLHLGNYLGAVRNWVGYLDDYDCFFGVVDMHAITMPYTPAELRKNTLDCVAQYVACGLDPAKCHIFIQSQVGLHPDLAWILGCLCPLGQLERMTQYKDKSKRAGHSVGAGLLYYPILQAADILLYNADIVPVGEDQKQHLELTRDLAEKFNHTYSDTFTMPEVRIPKEGARIMSLQDPESKMSKSDPNQSGVLYLWDEPKVIRKKIMSAVTDSGDEIVARDDKPGMKNLLTIMSAATGKTIRELELEFEGRGYGEFKAAVAESVVEMLEPLQARYHELKGNKEALKEIVKDGLVFAQKRAWKTMSKVYKKAGFLIKATPKPEPFTKLFEKIRERKKTEKIGLEFHQRRIKWMKKGKKKSASKKIKAPIEIKKKSPEITRRLGPTSRL